MDKNMARHLLFINQMFHKLCLLISLIRKIFLSLNFKMRKILDKMFWRMLRGWMREEVEVKRVTVIEMLGDLKLVKWKGWRPMNKCCRLRRKRTCLK